MGRGRSHRGGFPHAQRAKAERAAAERAQLYQKIRDAHLKHAEVYKEPSITPQPDGFLTALRNIRLQLPDTKAALAPSPTYIALAAALHRCATLKRSEAVLCWPAHNVSIPAVHALSVLATIEDCAPLEGSPNGLSQPRPLRVLQYPWSPRTRHPLKNVYVCKESVSRLHLRHLQRYPRGPTGNDPFYDLHLSLVRVRDLDGSALDDEEEYAELQHPTLNELIPSGACGSTQHTLGLLHRSRSKTKLKTASSCPYADDPRFAPYYLFGLPADADARSALKVLPPPIQAVLLDLTRSGRNRLHNDWRGYVERCLRQLKAIRADVPVLAITDDPWVHRELTWRILKDHEGIKGKRPAAHSAVFAPSSTIPDVHPPESVFSGCASISAQGFAGQLDGVLATISDLRTRAMRLGDKNADALLQELASILRRCANLPGGVFDVGKYAADEAGDTAATHIMSAYQVPRLLASLDRLEGPLAHSRRGPLNDLSLAAKKAWDTQCLSSPMSLLLGDVLKPLLRNSSKTVVLFRRRMLADYATWALSNHPEIGPLITRRLENGMLTFLDEIGFREASGLPRRERHQIHTIVLVCPTRAQLLSHMAQPWLPEREIVLGDAHTLSAVSRDAAQLAAFPAFAGFAQRLLKLAEAAQKGADTVFGRKVILEPTAAPPDDVDFPTGKMVDLSGAHGSPDDVLIKLETEDRQTILARRRTKLVEYDSQTAVPVYRELSATESEVGDLVCVIDDDFVDMARSRLDIGYAASSEMRSYHQLVTALFANLPGFTHRGKRQELARRINDLRSSQQDREVTEAGVRYWVDLSDALSLPLEEVTPHAPQDLSTFKRFMTALGVSEPIALQYWNWAVIGTRSGRLKAAHRLHEAYLGILISPHSAEAENPRRVADIRQLRASAEAFVSRINNKSVIRRADLCA